MLAAHERAGSFIEAPVAGAAAELLAAAPARSLRQRRYSDSTGRRRIILVGLFFTLMCVGIGVNSYHSILYFSTAGDPGWLVGPDGRVRTYS